MSKQLIAFTDTSDQDSNNLFEIYLPCPRSSRRSIYFQNNKGQLYEVQNVKGPGRKASFLIDSYIYKDGAVRFITRMDPLFMALPILNQVYKKDDSKFNTLDVIFSRENINLELDLDSDEEEEEKFEAYSQPIDVHRLITLSGFTEQLAHMCDIKEVVSGLFVYRLNPKLALDWLTKKVDQILSKQAFQTAFESTKQDQDLMKLEAVYIISNYLNKEWFDKLLNHFNLIEPKEKEAELLTNYATNASPAAFFKRVHPDEMLVNSSVAKKKKPDVPRSLSKVNTKGMKSLTSFFTTTKKQ